MANESASERLARVETLLAELVKGVDRLSEDFREFGDRLTRLEESTRDVYKLRERIAELERDTAQMKLETANIKLELERFKLSCDGHRKTSGSRWWDVAKLIMSPAVAALVAWIIAKGAK